MHTHRFNNYLVYICNAMNGLGSYAAPEGRGAGQRNAAHSSDGTRAVFRYEKEFRWTRLDGIDKYIAICLSCRQVVEPTGTYRSRSGTHGTDYYEHEHPLRFVFLYSSNSGNRDYGIDEGLEFLDDLVKSLWIYQRVWPADVKEAIKKKLEG